jgi:hypothetical protein
MAKARIGIFGQLVFSCSVAAIGAVAAPVARVSDAADFENRYAALRDHELQRDAEADELAFHEKAEAAQSQIILLQQTAEDVKALWQSHALDEAPYQRAELSVEIAQRQKQVWEAKARVADTQKAIAILLQAADAGSVVSTAQLDADYQTLGAAKYEAALIDSEQAALEVKYAESDYHTLLDLYENRADSGQALRAARSKLEKANIRLNSTLLLVKQLEPVPAAPSHG